MSSIAPCESADEPYLVRVLADEGRSDPEAGYLKEKTTDWLPSHFNSASYKSKRRKYFASPKK
jgi:hypothetical protein